MNETGADIETPYRTVKEVASYYRVCSKTVTRWIRGGLPARNIGSEKRPDWRIRIADVETFLDTRSHGEYGRLKP